MTDVQGAQIGPMSDALFTRLSTYVRSQTGVNLTSAKKPLLEGRLRRRLQLLHLRSFDEYASFIMTPRGQAQELASLIDAVTTHKTDFFREPRHFDYLREEVLPNFGRGERVRLWSAACSTGEEPWTLAMVAAEGAESHGYTFSVLATDISQRVLMEARRGIYPEDRVAPVPPAHRSRYLLRSRDRSQKLVRIAPELRPLVEFRHLNLTADFRLPEPVDVIFCRNVIIYFDAETRDRVVERLYNNLVPGGHLFMGHSETLTNQTVPLEYTAATVYRKPERCR